MNKLWKTLKRIGVFSIVFILLLPWGIYYKSLTSIQAFPSPPSVVLESDELDRLWANNEKKAIRSKINDITPYWMYHWLAKAIANDYFKIKDFSDPSEKMSYMAGIVAITHLRNGDFREGKSTLGWHISNVCLTIWLQRNWSANSIAEKYKEFSIIGLREDVLRLKGTFPDESLK